jgi:hypothetical protein
MSASQFSDILSFIESQNLPEGTYLKICKNLKHIYENTETQNVANPDIILNTTECPIKLVINDDINVVVKSSFRRHGKNQWGMNGYVTKHNAELIQNDKVTKLVISRTNEDVDLELIAEMVDVEKFTIQFLTFEKVFTYSEWREKNEAEDDDVKNAFITDILIKYQDMLNKWCNKFI